MRERMGGGDQPHTRAVESDDHRMGGGNREGKARKNMTPQTLTVTAESVTAAFLRREIQEMGWFGRREGHF